MGSTFTCPNCGRRGSVKKELSPHAKLRCPGCQSLFSPTLSRMPAPSGPTVEDQIEEYLRSGPLPSSPLSVAPTPLDEPVVTPSLPQPSSPLTTVAQPPPLPREATEIERQPSRAQRNPVRFLMISGGLILCLGVLATIVFFIAQAHKVTPGLFDSVHRSAKALEGTSQVGLDQGKFRELLQGLSTELAIVKDKRKRSHPGTPENKRFSHSSTTVKRRFYECRTLSNPLFSLSRPVNAYG